MKTIKGIVCLIYLVLIFGCTNDQSVSTKNNPSEFNDFYTAEVISIDNIDCHLTEIVFIGDTTGISELLDDDSFSYSKSAFEKNPKSYHFLVTNLDDSLNIKDNQIKIKFRVPLQSEYVSCTHLGPTYPMITILSASKLE